MKGWGFMSEFIRCNICGDLTSFEETTYINNNPICPDCHEKTEYMLLEIAEKQ